MNIHDLTLARQLAESRKAETNQRDKASLKKSPQNLLENANTFAAELERFSQTKVSGSQNVSSTSATNQNDSLKHNRQEMHELMQLMQMAGTKSQTSPSATLIEQAAALVPPKK